MINKQSSNVNTINKAFVPGAGADSLNSSKANIQQEQSEVQAKPQGRRFRFRPQKKVTTEKQKFDAPQTRSKYEQKVVHDKDGILIVPNGTNSLQLSRMIGKDLFELKDMIDMIGEDFGIVIVDEFQSLPKVIIENVCGDYDIEHKIIETDTIRYKKRPPIVTIMGHVDHGKTTLLDAFRNSDLCGQEYGEITQSTAAFSFKTEKGYYCTFIDTPGHEVFDSMRLRGAKVTDIVIVVISSIEGVQNQTREVLGLVKKFNLPMIVALNKIDSYNSDADNVILDLINEGVELDEVGGDVPSARISALKKQGLNDLEERITELAESLNLKEDYE